MFGSGLYFNSPDIVKVEKTFTEGVNGFTFTEVGPSFKAQNIITELPLKGPSLIPFIVVVNAVELVGGAASKFYLSYYQDNNLIGSLLHESDYQDGSAIHVMPALNYLNWGSTNWSTATTNAGICFLSDDSWTSGTSITITLYCIRSGLNY